MAKFSQNSRQILSGAAGFVATAMALIFLQPAASARTPQQVNEKNKAIVTAHFDAWRAGTGGPFDLLADDARWTIEGHSVASKTYPTKEAFMSEVIRPFNARMRAPLKPVIRNLYADRDSIIVHFDARGTALDGKPYVNTYAWFLDMRDGKIVRASAFFDAIAFNDLWSRVEPGQ